MMSWNVYTSQVFFVRLEILHVSSTQPPLPPPPPHTQAPSPLPQTPSQKTQIQQTLQNIVGKTEVNRFNPLTPVCNPHALCVAMQALETTYRNLSSKLENFKVQYHEAFQLDSELIEIECVMYIIVQSLPLSLPLFLPSSLLHPCILSFLSPSLFPPLPLSLSPSLPFPLSPSPLPHRCVTSREQDPSGPGGQV